MASRVVPYGWLFLLQRTGIEAPKKDCSNDNRSKTTSETSGSPENQTADSGDRIDSPPNQRCGVIPILYPPRTLCAAGKLAVRGWLRPCGGNSRQSVCKAGSHRFCMGVHASFLRGHPLPFARFTKRHFTRSYPAIKQDRHWRESCANSLCGGKNMVNRIVVGAHYGLKDWLVQ